MIRFSQNTEQEVILQYFGDTTGTFLDIGANDGQTFSNTRALAIGGWGGVCVEPSPRAFKALNELYPVGCGVQCLNFAVGGADAAGELLTLHDGSDTLVSSLEKSHTGKWGSLGITFNPVEVRVEPFSYLLDVSRYQSFDMVSIDAEGYDWTILQQMDLDVLETRLLVIEYGNHLTAIKAYAEGFGLKELTRNGENLILAR